MNKKHTTQVLRSVLSVIAAVSLLVGMVPAVFAAGEKATTVGKQEEQALIQLLDDLKVNYQQYLDSNVAFRLPDGIADDEEISVIIRHDAPSLMDAYDKTDKTMSLKEYAASDEAAVVLEALDVNT